MARSVLQIAQDACDELGIDRPSQLVGATDPGARQILALMNKVAAEMAEWTNTGWDVLQRLYTFNTVASQDEYDLPSDYYRMIDQTAWSMGQRAPMEGSLTPAQWRQIKSGLIGTAGFYQRFRMMRSANANVKKFFIDPVPSSVQPISFEYTSNATFLSFDAATVTERIAADNNTFLLDENALIYGLKYRYRMENGLDYDAYKLEYTRLVDQKIAADRPSRVIDLTAARPSVLINERNFPDTGLGNGN